jgi:hypothetical protein
MVCSTAGYKKGLKDGMVNNDSLQLANTTVDVIPQFNNVLGVEDGVMGL